MWPLCPHCHTSGATLAALLPRGAPSCGFSSFWEGRPPLACLRRDLGSAFYETSLPAREMPVGLVFHAVAPFWAGAPSRGCSGRAWRRRGVVCAPGVAVGAVTAPAAAKGHTGAWLRAISLVGSAQREPALHSLRCPSAASCLQRWHSQPVLPARAPAGTFPSRKQVPSSPAGCWGTLGDPQREQSLPAPLPSPMVGCIGVLWSLTTLHSSNKCFGSVPRGDGDGSLGWAGKEAAACQGAKDPWGAGTGGL